MSEGEREAAQCFHPQGVWQSVSVSGEHNTLPLPSACLSQFMRGNRQTRAVSY